MDSSTVFILQIAGPLLIIEAIALFFNGGYFQKLVKSMKKETLSMYLAGFGTFILGMSIVLSQSGLSGTGALILTILGYISTLKGALLILAPDSLVDFSQKIPMTGVFIKTLAAVFGVLGIYVCMLVF